MRRLLDGIGYGGHFGRGWIPAYAGMTGGCGNDVDRGMTGEGIYDCRFTMYDCRGWIPAFAGMTWVGAGMT